MDESIDRAAVALAFSTHRFEDSLPHLAKDVRWTIVGYMVLEGADAVVRTCTETRESLADTDTTLQRCVTAAQGEVVAVDTLARYTGPNGVTAVAGCDIFEFTGDRITAITSYAVQVDPDCSGAPQR
ncbi:nuclear transport factor 2 family protein [Mycolicibacterium bacteremicum]|uniref:Limonene-1,2-epoxide hydrolase n=2 Tax=Mycolicibacterium TaxID=1866885 RepID=A0A1W9YN90_MYCBA|nr:nuclear transport factor 2 family protein [Mycolicibacterium bacteremicum]MCV7433349.1 nuclear transport factor 2 family protein [Mycolicibacterium bacteremicum]ORA01548.1 limonene-1,2-epoxide hydrolase [Mycolicibacterium bacteremicum]